MKKKGFTLVETIVALGVFSFLIVGIMELYAGSLSFFNRTSTDVEITNDNSNAMRYITQELRSAMNIQITNHGNTISYEMPEMSTFVEPLTGEVELKDPVVSDGVFRSFTVVNGVLTDTYANKVLLEDLASKDPDPDSTQYNQEYAPFQLTTIGSRRAVTVTLISQRDAGGSDRYVRMKNTVILRNSQ